MGSTTPEGLMNSQLRRIVIRSLLVILNFVYTKKYLKDVIAGFSAKPTDPLGLAKSKSPPAPCALEDLSSLKVLKEGLFRVINASKQLPPEPSAAKESKTKGKAEANPGFTTYPDFRDINEEVIFLFCSFAMSQNFLVAQLCSHVLPIGQSILSHCIYSLQKAQQTMASQGQVADQYQGGAVTSLTQICSLSSINAMLESLVVLLRDDQRNKEI